ncbi:MAG TPA: ROK family transcriptional regulator [Anaerolineae bacterium]|nr:ROK family transcriptional regulator [Anaerolineae bacterium]
MIKKASHEQTRLYNSQLVLKTIYSAGQISRAEVARATELTRPTVSDVVAELLLQGLVREVGLAPSQGGKRPMMLSMVDDSRHLLGLDLGREDFRGALINLRGVIQHRINVPRPDGNGDAALAAVYDLVDALFRATNRPLLGIGIGAPGLVDADNGVIYQAVNLNWQNVPLRELLEKRYGVPVYMANDCQVAALAEYTFGDGNHTVDLVVIHVGWGVGAGIVHNGRLLHGNPFGAGEIGHIILPENHELCHCGRVGCLEAAVNTRAILREVRAAAQASPDFARRLPVSPDVVTFDTVQAMFAAGDPTVQRIVGAVGRSLGIVTAYLVGILGGCRILIAGRLAGCGEFLLDAIRVEMAQRTLDSLAQNTEIGYVSLGADIVLRGASALLLHHELGLF